MCTKILKDVCAALWVVTSVNQPTIHKWEGIYKLWFTLSRLLFGI